MGCRNKPCVSGCPVSVDMPAFMALVKEGRIEEAARKVKEKNSLPAICGRVCPQEDQCESRCVLAKSGRAVAIGALERFVADYERGKGSSLGQAAKKPVRPRHAAKVAVVGSGPAGLTAAADLALMGHGYGLRIAPCLRRGSEIRDTGVQTSKGYLGLRDRLYSEPRSGVRAKRHSGQDYRGR